MRQFKKTEHRVWTNQAWQEALGQAKTAAQRAAKLQAEKERLVAEGKLRKIITKEGNTTRFHYEPIK